MLKVAITGGAAGIGGATVELMLAKGWEVTVFGRTKPDNSRAQFIHFDIGDDSSIENALTSTNDEYDALVSNAGLPPKKGLETEILSVNFFGLRKFALGLEAKLNLSDVRHLRFFRSMSDTKFQRIFWPEPDHPSCKRPLVLSV